MKLKKIEDNSDKHHGVSLNSHQEKFIRKVQKCHKIYYFNNFEQISSLKCQSVFFGNIAIFSSSLQMEFSVLKELLLLNMCLRNNFKAQQFL